jgi:hypothetical protein
MIGVTVVGDPVAVGSAHTAFGANGELARTDAVEAVARLVDEIEAGSAAGAAA